MGAAAARGAVTSVFVVDDMCCGCGCDGGSCRGASAAGDGAVASIAMSLGMAGSEAGAAALAVFRRLNLNPPSFSTAASVACLRPRVEREADGGGSASARSGTAEVVAADWVWGCSCSCMDSSCASTSLRRRARVERGASCSVGRSKATDLRLVWRIVALSNSGGSDGSASTLCQPTGGGRGSPKRPTSVQVWDVRLPASAGLPSTPPLFSGPRSVAGPGTTRGTCVRRERRSAVLWEAGEAQDFTVTPCRLHRSAPKK